MHKFIKSFYCPSGCKDVGVFIYTTPVDNWRYSHDVPLKEKCSTCDIPIAISTYWRGYLYA